MKQIYNSYFKTHPQVLHFPGKSYKKNYNSKMIYEHIKEHKFNDTILKNCCIVTVASNNINETMLFNQFLNSKAQIIRLGSNISKKFNTFFKLTEMLKFVNQTDKEFVLFLDANDTLLIGNIDNIFIQYQNFYKNKILFSAEKKFSYFFKRSKIFSHRADDIKKFLIQQSNNSPYFSLNSGIYISSIGLLKEILPLVIEEYTKIKIIDSEMRSSDQSMWMYYWYVYDQSSIVLDNECKIFQSCNFLSNNEININI